jgi:SAM-dependent methyltransferase
MPDFKDYFSTKSAQYAKHRPHYPIELYSYLSGLTPCHNLAWDCGTGNGQAALGLSPFYSKVIATDPSVQQIQNAILKENIDYRIEKAEQTSIPSKSVDLITIANALHWFDFDSFYEEVNRVLKLNGIIAAWCYGLPQIDPDVDHLLKHFHEVILNDYWLYENRLVEQEYKTIPFPFPKIESPEFTTTKELAPLEFIDFINTWSAVQRYLQTNGINPTNELSDNMLPIWKDVNSRKKVSWKLILKMGRI